MFRIEDGKLHVGLNKDPLKGHAKDSSKAHIKETPLIVKIR